jgi:hypothetical protein
MVGGDVAKPLRDGWPMQTGRIGMLRLGHAPVLF